jgi:DNA segregation ATPase FtsK/SpoIIIE, S-DNA-T family
MAKKTKRSAPPKKKDAHEIKGIACLSITLAFLLSLVSFSLHGSMTHNWLGAAGYILGWTLTGLLGLGSYLFVLFIGWIGWRLMFKKPINRIAQKTAYAIAAIFSFCMLLSVIEVSYPSMAQWMSTAFYKNSIEYKHRYHLGGAPLFYLYHDLPKYNLAYLLNAIGAVILFSTTFIASLLLLAKVNPFPLIQNGFNKLKSIQWRREKKPPVPEPIIKSPAKPFKGAIEEIEEKTESDFLRYVKLRIPGLQAQNLPQQPSEAPQPEMLQINPETNLKARPSLSRKEKEPIEKPKQEEVKQAEPVPQPTPPKNNRREAALAAQRVHNGDFTSYKLPALNFLTNAKKLDHSSLKKDLRHKAEVLEETLLSFGIEAKVGEINCGPTITSFEVHPAIGVKVQKIKALENDIALNMEAKSIRIIAPIPGKAVVGIEVPNAQAEEVGFKEMMAAYQQGEKKFQIPILLGKAVNGDYVMSDLTKMPHCIIAGATGSGKSVCINTIVMSILMNAKPDEIKLIMVDPKKVELTPYTHLPHMLAPVITEPQGACAALNWLVKEMEKRYDLLKQIGARNIEAFNKRTIDKDFEASLGLEIPEKLPYIVGIIDELADLMMVSSSDIETPIARIAQMARAVGIHLILATQRPSREVITGLIKANFPTRISFKVSSRVNSQIVLDDVGAESLLGNGDMLFLPPGASHLVRAQGAFIRDEDINAVVKSICEQAPPRYVIESFDRIGQIDMSDMEEEDDPGDSLYSQALDVVVSTGNASTTFLQRKLKIGYARAASLMDMLEKKGIVSTAEGSKARKVLAGRSNAKENDDDLLDELNEFGVR